MKTPTLLPIIIFVTSLACFIGTAGAARQDAARAAIAAQSQALMAAIEKGDAAAIAPLFTTDARLSVAGVEGVLNGRAAIVDFWRAAFSGGLGRLTLVSSDLIGDGSLRVETGSYQAAGANQQELGRGQYLLVWQKQDGAWRISRDFAHGAAPVAASARQVDRVGFPRDYALQFHGLGGTLNDESQGLTTVYANELAASATGAEQANYPYGSVILMEFAEPQRDGEQQLLRDARGQPLKGAVAHIDVMRRAAGYGTTYGKDRAGEWEFASYRADGSTLISSDHAAHCAACHLKAGAAKDFVFRLRSWSPMTAPGTTPDPPSRH
jgi:uncharacterized protein (TIGR02246 family)